MQKIKKDRIRLIIAIVLIVSILVGMIVSTVVLSNSKYEDFEYYSKSAGYDYYGDQSGVAFQHATRFKMAFTNYLKDSFGDIFNKYTTLPNIVESAVGLFADRLILAMGEAQIPSTKLDLMATKINQKKLFVTLNKFWKTLEEYDDIESALDDFQKFVEDFSLMSFIGEGISTFLKESSLTEDEVADIIYYYLSKNSNETYKAYLNLVGKEFFTNLISNTIYVVSTFYQYNTSDYQLMATSYSLKEVLYQLGSIYLQVEKIGGINVERSLFGAWDFNNTSLQNKEELKEINDNIEGQTSDLLIVIGALLKDISAEEIETYLRYTSLEKTSDEKKQLGIHIASMLSKKLANNISSYTEYCTNSYTTISSYIDSLTLLQSGLYTMTTLINGGSALSSEYLENLEGIQESNDRLKDAIIYFSEIDISGISKGTEAYTELENKSKIVMGISDSIVSVIVQNMSVGISTKIQQYISEAQNG